MKEKQFVGARVGDKWYCCTCLDIRFTDVVANRVMKYGQDGNLKAVYTTDVWVQDKACVNCHERFDTEP